MPEDPLLWPYLEIQIIEEYRETNKLFNFGQGCENCFTTVSLLDFADDLVSDGERLMYCKEQLKRNQDRLLLMQPQINPKDFMHNRGIALDFNTLGGAGNTREHDTNMPMAGAG